MEEVSANPDAAASASEEGSGGGGDSSVDRVPSNNQDEEEEEEDGSAYGSEEFDDQSKAGATESEVRIVEIFPLPVSHLPLQNPVAIS